MKELVWKKAGDDIKWDFMPPSAEIRQFLAAMDFMNSVCMASANVNKIAEVVEMLTQPALHGLVEAAERGMIVLEFCVKLASQTGESTQSGFVSWVQEKFDIFSMIIDESDGHLHHDPLVINAVDQSESYILEFL